ncbi:jg15390 [Pararge aegeria aegeria]|uniref:Jg15390 protein n=1 Tax=Pararge aegeria aegeria TaxID=348720 RepID=A0A8S4SAL7_9NEOP|nr:jg15390 [Pararge aegeria aegeria]
MGSMPCGGGNPHGCQQASTKLTCPTALGVESVPYGLKPPTFSGIPSRDRNTHYFRNGAAYLLIGFIRHTTGTLNRLAARLSVERSLATSEDFHQSKLKEIQNLIIPKLSCQYANPGSPT